jgi:hypothetical protein
VLGDVGNQLYICNVLQCELWLNNL